MVIIETHAHFCVSIVQGYCMDSDENLVVSRSRQEVCLECEIFQAILFGDPLSVLRSDSHSFGCSCFVRSVERTLACEYCKYVLEDGI